MPGVTRRAFTLIEVLLALSVVAILTVALFASLHAAFKAKRSAEAALELNRTGEAVMEMVLADLQAALPPRGTLAGAFTGTSAAGDTGDVDAVVFYAAAPVPPGTPAVGEVRKIELRVMSLVATGERVLARRVTSDLLSPNLVEPDDEILCRGVVGFDVSYYDGTSWWTTWDSTTEKNALPVAAAVTLELEAPESRRKVGDLRPLHYKRYVTFPCAGEGDTSDQPDATADDGDGGTGTSGAGSSGAAGGTQ